MNRRDLVKLAVGGITAGAAPIILGGAAWAQAAAPAAAPAAANAAAFVLPPLAYPFEALEPHIDVATMRVHHGTHHAGYVRNLNAITEKKPVVASLPMEKTLAAIDTLPADIRDGVRNNMGGHWNHTFFWDVMTPGGAKTPTGPLRAAIDGAFGSVLAMQDAVTAAGLARFGSGWAWLGVGPNRGLTVFSTPYQDTPHMVAGIRGAVLGVDVWEHAYYLKYQARRGEYLKSWWNTVNWDKAAANFAIAVR